MRITYQTRLLQLLARAEKDGQCQVNNNEIAFALGFASLASSSRIVRETAAAGLISITMIDSNTRKMVLTDRGRQRLAGSPELPPPPPVVIRHCQRLEVAELPAVGDSDERAARKAAASANDRFVAALAKLAPVADALDRDTTTYRRLPPPALTGQAFT
jgi:hypothetical protein